MNCKFLLARVKFTWQRYEMRIMNRLLSDAVALISPYNIVPICFSDGRPMRNFIKGANKKKKNRPHACLLCFRAPIQSQSESVFQAAAAFPASFLDLCLLFIQLGHRRHKSPQKQLHNPLIWHLNTEGKHIQTAI